jgi:putative proteasome-type protease
MGIEFNCTLIFGGQIGNERCRLFQVYSAGNFIEAQDENLYFQIGESKYGKPILDRVVEPETTLDEAAKCTLISMDSTLRSNLSVGLPLDLLCYETGSLRVTRFVTIEADNEYFQIIRKTWGQQLRSAFAALPDPTWYAQGASGKPATPVRAPAPQGAQKTERKPPIQAFAQAPKSSDPSGPSG